MGGGERERARRNCHAGVIAALWRQARGGDEGPRPSTRPLTPARCAHDARLRHTRTQPRCGHATLGISASNQHQSSRPLPLIKTAGAVKKPGGRVVSSGWSFLSAQSPATEREGVGEGGGCQKVGGGGVGRGMVVELVLVLIPVFNRALGNHQLQVVSCWCECVGVQHTINYTTTYRGYLPVKSEPLTTLPRDCLLPPFLPSFLPHR